MSVEIIEDILVTIKSSPKQDFSDILKECLSYSFIEDTRLAALFELDLTDLEDLLEDSSTLTSVEWNKYANKLYRYLNKEKSQYDLLYYADE